MIRIVLTGGPHSGKTTLIDALEHRGLPVLREAAIEEIRLLNAELGGSSLQRQWRLANMQEFQLRVARRQRDAERALDAQGVELAILDRGTIDGIAYCALHGIAVPDELATIAQASRYALVLSCELILPFQGRAESGRISDEAAAVQISELLEHTYAAYNVPVQRLAALPLAEREDRAWRLIQATLSAGSPA
jgi:predicted ATPase